MSEGNTWFTPRKYVAKSNSYMSGNTIIYSPTGRIVVELKGGKDADFVANAINSHESLMLKVSELQRALESCSESAK